MDPQTIAGGAIGAVVVVLVGTKLLGLIKPTSTAPKARARADDKHTSKAIEDGDYAAAAARVSEAGDLESAYELYLLAQQPLKAAQIAIGLGKPALAAELYEKAGDKARAIVSYRLAEMTSKAKELEAEMAAAAGGEAKPPAKLAGPVDRAEQAEVRWRTAARESATSTDPTTKERVEAIAQSAAEAWISAGDMKRAAEFCREAGLVDYAMNLYVNALGDPASAAKLMAERGDHKRAAELYELAGQAERSVEAWVEWSKGADDPLACLDDVKRLGEEPAATFLQAVMAARPIVPNNIDLHYRIAMAMEHRPEHAKAVVDRIAALEPGYRDINARIEQLAEQIAKLAEGKAATSAEIAPEAPAEEGSAPSGGLLEGGATRPALGSYVVRPVARGAGPGNPAVSGDPSRSLADDPLVHEAERGPSVASLRDVIGRRAPDLGNIEVYYRLGIALLAQGKYGEAQRAFGQVEEVSPGYRDAEARSSQVEAWKMEGLRSLVPDAESGQVAKRYKLLGRLGRGTTAVVYRARDESIGRDVALKFLTDDAAANKDFKESFAREARAAWSLTHRNIVKIYDVSQLEGRPFLCMELVDGVSVEALLEKDTRIAVPDALAITEQVLVALDHAHGKNVVHRGIKPANILRARAGSVKVVDFGLADPIDLAQAQESTAITGNPAYMAPEQLAGRCIDARTDLFALGATLFEMLTGELAYEGTERTGAPRSLLELLPAAPPSLDALVARSLELESDRRFSSAGEMLAAVRSLRQEA